MDDEIECKGDTVQIDVVLADLQMHLLKLIEKCSVIYSKHWEINHNNMVIITHHCKVATTTVLLCNTLMVQIKIVILICTLQMTTAFLLIIKKIFTKITKINTLNNCAKVYKWHN